MGETILNRNALQLSKTSLIFLSLLYKINMIIYNNKKKKTFNIPELGYS